MMSVDHVMFALILSVSITTILVNGGPSKRHSSSTPRSGRPISASDDTSCRDVCDNVIDYCNESCYPPGYTTINPGEVTTRSFVDHTKFDCVGKCLEEGEPIVFEEESCSTEPEKIQPNDDGATPIPGENEVVDVFGMTMTDRCHMELWKNTTVCAFDRENPSVSKKVFESNKPKLTLCPGSPVFKGLNGFSLKKSFSRQENQTTATLSRKERSVFDGIGSPTEPLGENLTANQDTKMEPKSWRNTAEFCKTLHNYESPRSAIHFATDLVVDLYFYAGYSQWFHLGECDAKRPKQNMPKGIESHCDVAHTAMKAWIMIDPKTFDKTDEVKNCGTVKDVSYLVCNDWILLPTHCKHYFSL